MKTPPITLEEVYNQKLTELLAAEKKYVKCMEQMASAAFTAELRTGISPDTTDIANHIERLTQIISLRKIKVPRSTTEVDDELLKLGKEVCGFLKQQSILKDIQILHCVKTILNVKIAGYESVHMMATALKQDNAALLLEQSCKDNQNIYAYLTQIAQNIIYPKARGE